MSDTTRDTVSEIAALHRESERQQRELERRQEQVLRLNRELDDSGRGLVALYAELDDRSHQLQRESELKTRFVANVSHELRTPINSILGLTKLLLARTDGELTPEQEKQVGFVRKSAEALSELVNDLLDLSKVESGKTTVRPSRFEVGEFFGTLRGMLRPLLAGDGDGVVGAGGREVALVFDDPAGLPPLETDEGKVAQVLRNLISNALKFTERGEVRVSARAHDDGTISFAVRDTGVGIAREDQARIFEEFAQLDNPLQGRVKGTGLGLALSRRLATLLGGTLTVDSALGEGSTFTLTIPRVHPEAAEMAEFEARSRHPDPARAPILVVEDDRPTLFLYEKYLEGTGFQVLPARNIDAARASIRTTRPAAILLDIMLEGETTWAFLAELKRDPATRDIPTLVVTVVDREQKARALGADEFFVKPIDRDWLLRKLQTLAVKGPVEKVLVIDDDEVARYLVRRLLADTRYSVIEAGDGPEGVRLARESLPDVILLDFVMPTMTAFDVLDQLKTDGRTRCIPVIISTSKQLDEAERQRLSTDTAAILSKENLSREVAITRIREALEKAIPAAERGAASERAPHQPQHSSNPYQREVTRS